VNAPLLEIRDLTVTAGRHVLLDRVSLNVQAGEIVGLIGESGAGKSTLGLVALGYLKTGCTIVEGSVLLRGRQLRDMSEAELRDVRQRHATYVAQSAASAFDPSWRIGDQVVEVCKVRGDASATDALAIELFKRLDLPDNFTRRFPHQVSGGQLQRAMLAMALAPEPDLIVFDEPTTALDVTTQLEVLRTIRQAIRKRRVAGLYISHDIALVAQMTDRMLVLREGRMVEVGRTAAMLVAPKADYTRQLLAARQRADPHPKTDPAGAPILAFKSVTAGYGRGPAVVKEATFALLKGGVLAIVGQSGSGKSSAARVATGLLVPRNGSVELDGSPLPASLDQRTRELRRRIQLVHQSPDTSLNPRQTVRTIIERPLRFFFNLPDNEVERRVRDLLMATELSENLLERYPQSLSGGQKQRMCIARALAAEPDVLICDEVTSALDPLVEDAVITLLSRIRQERGLAILFITHNLALAQRFADYVVVMQRGRIVEQSDSATLFDRPREAYTKGLLAAIPTLEPGWLDRQLS